MADNKIGDFTNSETISVEDVQYFLNGMKSGLFLDQSNVDFEKSNIALKHPFQGPDFYEVLKLHAIQQSASDGTYGDGENEPLSDLQTDGDNLDDYEFSLSSVVDETILQFGQKGASVDTYQDKIVVTFPRAKISNFFHAHGDAQTLVEKTIGYAKVYKIADTIDYSDYELILPPVFTSKSADSVPFDIEFGAESVAMHGNYIAVSAFYSRGPDAQNVHQPASAKVFLYEKVEASETSDPGYKFVSVFEDGDLACEPVLELHDDKLFVSDYVRNEIKVYSITTLKTLSNYAQPTAESKLVPRNIIRPAGDVEFNSEWGRSIVCRDGKNLYIGAPGAICKYSLPVATGMVEHWVYDFHEAESSDGEDSTDNPAEPWVLAQSLKPSESDLPWWTKYSEWSDTMCGANCLTREYQYLQSSESETSGSQVSAMCGYTPGKYDEEGETIPIQARGDWWCNVWQQDTELVDKTWTADSDAHLNNWWENTANQSDYPTTLSANDRANDWGVWFNEDLPGYYEPGPQGPVPIDYEWEIPTYMHFTTDIRFGETIDARGQKANATAPTNFDLEKQYVVVGAPRWFDDSVPQQENLSTERIGAVFVFDSMYTTDEDTSRVNGGTSSQIKRIIPTPQSSDTRVGAMEIDTIPWNEQLNELEQNFYDADAVSVHFQMELYEQSDLVNRGSPSFWPYSIYDGPHNFESNNVTFTWPEPAEMLHSDGTDAGGISAKGFMTFGEVDPETFSTWNKDYPESGDPTYSTKAGEALGYIKMGKNDSYSMNDDDLTIEFWWKPTHSYTNQTTADTETPTVHTASTSAPIMSYQAEDSKDAKQWWDLIYDASGGKLQLRYPDGETRNRYSTDTDYINVDTWYHIALVHEKREFSDTSATSNMRRIQLYVNGNPQFDYTDTGFTIPDDGESSALNFEHKVEELDSDDGKSQHLYIGASPGGLGTNIGSTDTGGFEGFGNHCFDDIRITHGVRYKQLMNDEETPKEIGFTIPGSAFEICYHEKGHGADVAMDADYDIFILNNTLTGYIEKHTNERYNYNTQDTLTSLDWSRTDMVSLSKDNPVIGGEISVYDTDLVYGNLNDLRIFPRNEDITISDGNIENRLVGGDAFEYKLETIDSSYNYTVKLRGMGTINWGDGTTEVYDSRESYKTFSHTFSTITENMNITITGLTGFGESSGADTGEAKIVDVGESIPSTLTEFRNSFKGCTSFNAENTKKWNTRYVKSMMGMFSGATSFDRDISNWNTESLENASYMFKNATSFNANLTNWFTGNIKNMASMFQGATTFNQPIDVWDVRNVENMDNMFNGASAFNQDLSMWCSKVISNDPDNFSTSTLLEANNLPNWNSDCRHGFVEFTFDVSEIEGEFTAVIPFTRSQSLGPFYNNPLREKEYYDHNSNHNFASRTYAGEYDWYVDWDHASGHIRDTEETYTGGIINEKWSVPGTLFGLTQEYLNEINLTQYYYNHFGRDWNNTKDHVLYHIYPDVTELSEIKVTVHTSDINYSDEYFDGYEYHGSDKDTPESWFVWHKDNVRGDFYRKAENERASSKYNLIYGVHTWPDGDFGGSIFCKNLKKVMVNNVQLHNIRIGYDFRNDIEYDYADYYDWNYLTEDRGNELKELDIRGLKWFDSWSTHNLSVLNFDTIKLDWPIQNPIRFDYIALTGVNQDYPNFPLYDSIAQRINLSNWSDINFELIKPQYDHFINRIQPQHGNRFSLSFYSINTISDPLTSIQVKFDNKETYDSLRAEKGLLEIQEGDVFIKNNYVSDDLSPISNLSTFNNENTNISYSDLENKPINFSDSDGFYVDIEVRENGKYYGDIDLTDSLKSNIVYAITVHDCDINQLLINDINVSSVSFQQSDIKNQDDVCKKIHSGNTGLTMHACFDGNKFTGILDISHWELYDWETRTTNNLEYAFRNFTAQKIILHPKFDLMVSSVSYFRWCWSGTLNIPNIRNWKINGERRMDFYGFFRNTKKFNQDLSTKIVERHGITYTAWDTSSVATMAQMFYETDKFNQDLTSWDVSNATDLSYMFYKSNFNGDISNWNTSNVTNLSGIFSENSKFNQDISTKIITGTNAETNPSYIAWDTQNATTIKRIFGGALSGRKEIGNNLSIENWNLDKVRDIGELFFANKGNNDGSTIDLRTKIVILDNSSETDDEELKIRKVYIAWNTNTVTSASGTFYYTKTPNIQIDNWNVSNVQNLDTFLQTSDFNPDITKKSVNLLGFSDGYGSDDEETKTDQDKILEQLSDEEKQQLKGDDTSNPLTEYTAWYTLSVNSMTYFADYNDSFDRNLSDWCLKSMTSFPGQRDNTNNWRDKLNLENIGKDCTE